MNVYTSYFDNAHYLIAKGYYVVSIARFPPKEYKNNTISLLAPLPELLNKYKSGEYTQLQYKYAYINQLNNTNIDEICKAIEKISADNENKDIILLCFEKPDEFCHRHILAEWFNGFKLFGGCVHEWTAKDNINNKESKSIELF